MSISRIKKEVTKMIEATAKRNKINFYNEKKWIMAYWFKRSRKAQFTVKYLREQWIKWWGNDSERMWE